MPVDGNYRFIFDEGGACELFVESYEFTHCAGYGFFSFRWDFFGLFPFFADDVVWHWFIFDKGGACELLVEPYEFTHCAGYGFFPFWWDLFGLFSFFADDVVWYWFIFDKGGVGLLRVICVLGLWLSSLCVETV